MTIVDANDNTPVFVTRNMAAATNENVPVGTPLFQVVASDADKGANSAISFAITANNTDGLFAIHAGTGWISSARPLDREASATGFYTNTASGGSTAGSTGVIVGTILSLAAVAIAVGVVIVKNKKRRTAVGFDNIVRVPVRAISDNAFFSGFGQTSVTESAV